ncbi:hypothetical protein L1887_34884 [Cichorium endivia]|nr:hypothetical protein L1887_34884 [Cichorium endivia]
MHSEERSRPIRLSSYSVLVPSLRRFALRHHHSSLQSASPATLPVRHHHSGVAGHSRSSPPIGDSIPAGSSTSSIVPAIYSVTVCRGGTGRVPTVARAPTQDFTRISPELRVPNLYLQ